MKNLLFLFLLLSIACSQNTDTTKESLETVETPTEEAEEVGNTPVMANFDSLFFDLKGIEKYYVQNSLYRLHSLLKFKNDERFHLLKQELDKRNDNKRFYEIELIDVKNGYMEFRTLDEENEEGVTMVYWNKSNGDKLIGQSQYYCLDECFSELTFSLFNEEENTYTSLPVKEVIIEYDTLSKKTSLLLDQKIQKEGTDYGGIGTKFTLPQKGKNIEYCIENLCIDLVWNDGIFLIAEEE